MYCPICGTITTEETATRVDPFVVAEFSCGRCGNYQTEMMTSEEYETTKKGLECLARQSSVST